MCGRRPDRGARAPAGWITVAFLLLFPATPAAAIDPPRFVNEAASAGIDHPYTGGWEHYVGGGVAVFDCSGDGWPDLYLAGGTTPATLYRNVGTRGGPLAFAPVEDTPLALTGVTGAYPLDIDGDGVQDLAVLRVGPNALYRGLGGCRFELANEAWGFEPGDAWSTAFSAVWEAGQRRPTLAVGNYVDRTAPGAPFGTCHDNALYRPRDGERYGPPRPLRPGYCALSILFSDWNRDGVPDLRISNDRQYYRGGSEQLWRVAPDVAPRAYGRARVWPGAQDLGHGHRRGDRPHRRRLIRTLTSLTRLGRQQAGRPVRASRRFGIAVGQRPARPAYEDIAFSLGRTVTPAPYVDGGTMPSTPGIADVRLTSTTDGLRRLFFAQGQCRWGYVDSARRDPNNLLLGPGRTAASARRRSRAVIVALRASARGAALADLNLSTGLWDLGGRDREARSDLCGATSGCPRHGRSRSPGRWAAVTLLRLGSSRGPKPLTGSAPGRGCAPAAIVWRREG